MSNRVDNLQNWVWDLQLHNQSDNSFGKDSSSGRSQIACTISLCRRPTSTFSFEGLKTHQEKHDSLVGSVCVCVCSCVW